MKASTVPILLTFFLITNNLSTHSQGCLPEGITFTTQQQIDNFQTSYPDCTEIEGDVSIGEFMGEPTDISNLSGLNQINTIGGKLMLFGNPFLTDISGLNNLNLIGDSLKMKYNHQISDLDALYNLESIGSSLCLLYNNNLSDLSGLTNLSVVPETVEIKENQNLTSLVGLNGISELGGDLLIGQNALNNLNGLNSLQNISGNLIIQHSSISDLEGLESLSLINGNLVIYSNDLIMNFMGLHSLVEIGGELYVDNNPSLINFLGIENLEAIGNDLFVETNTSLGSFTGLDNLKTIGVDLLVFSNPLLETFDGLNNLEMIEGCLRIYDNPSLNNLQSFSSLTYVKAFNVSYNTSLTSISGLDNITSDSLVNIWIIYNDLLSECNIKSVCEYITQPNVIFAIYENATGCNSGEEVEDACPIGIKEASYSENSIRTFPNPAKESITIESKSKIESVIILDQTGQQVLKESIPRPNVDVSKLQPGLYFIEIKTENRIVREKLIIQ